MLSVEYVANLADRGFSRDAEFRERAHARFDRYSLVQESGLGINHGVGEAKAAIGRTLPGMLIWGAFLQAERNDQ